MFFRAMKAALIRALRVLLLCLPLFVFSFQAPSQDTRLSQRTTLLARDQRRCHAMKRRRFGENCNLINTLKKARTRSEINHAIEDLGVIDDPRTLTAVISKLRRSRQSERALQMFAEARRRGIELNVFTYNAAISACERTQQWRRALEYFDEMQQRGIEPDVITYSAVISACEKGAQWERALKLFDEMQQRGIKPDVISHNAVISACEKGAQWERALKLFDEMQQRGIEPNVITHNAVIFACGKGAQWERALKLFDEMQQRGIEANVITYSAVISACAKGAQWERALKLFDEMQQRGIEPEVITYNAVISACELSGELTIASRLFLQAESDGHFPSVWRGVDKIDLHDLTVPVARTVVRVALERLRSESQQDALLTVITGRGKHSEDGEAVLKPAIVAMFQDETQLSCAKNRNNPGRLEVRVLGAAKQS